MFLTEDLLKRMIQEINDDYLTQVPADYESPPSEAELAMDQLTDELVEIQLDIQEGVNFMGQGMDYEEFLTIVGNYVISYESRRGGMPNKFLRKSIKGAVQSALADVPQIIADSIAEVLEDYIEDDRYEMEPATDAEREDYDLGDYE